MKQTIERDEENKMSADDDKLREKLEELDNNQTIMSEIKYTIENINKGGGKQKYKKYNLLNEAMIKWYYLIQLPKRSESYNMEINNPDAPNHIIVGDQWLKIYISDHKQSHKNPDKVY